MPKKQLKKDKVIQICYDNDGNLTLLYSSGRVVRTVKTPIKECDCICHIKDRLQGLPHFPSECECHNKPTVKEHTCSEDHYGNCYTCGKNMLTVKECEHGLSYEYSEDGCKKPTDNSEKNEHDPKVETYNCPACIKDQKIEEIISGLSKNFPGIFRYPEHLDEVESWLRDKLKDICK